MDLEDRVAALEQQVETLKQLIAAQKGIDLWLTPSKTSSVLGVSSDYIRKQIRRAHIHPKSSELKYGKHYRNKGSVNAARPSWQVNVVEFSKFLAIPVEKRKSSNF